LNVEYKKNISSYDLRASSKNHLINQIINPLIAQKMHYMNALKQQ